MFNLKLFPKPQSFSPPNTPPRKHYYYFCQAKSYPIGKSVPLTGNCTSEIIFHSKELNHIPSGNQFRSQEVRQAKSYLIVKSGFLLGSLAKSYPIIGKSYPPSITAQSLFFPEKTKFVLYFIFVNLNTNYYWPTYTILCSSILAKADRLRSY